MELPITGGCGCGAVRFEVSKPFVSAAYCHCTRCQRRTGTAAVGDRARRAGHGADRRRARRSSAAGRPRAGARRCSAPAAARRSSAASRDRRPHRRPARRDRRRSGDPARGRASSSPYAACWEEIPDDGLPRYRRPPDGPGADARGQVRALRGQSGDALLDDDEPVALERLDDLGVEAGGPPGRDRRRAGASPPDAGGTSPRSATASGAGSSRVPRDGQSPASGQPSQRGIRARQIVAPRSISACAAAPVNACAGAPLDALDVHVARQDVLAEGEVRAPPRPCTGRRRAAS